MEEVKTQIQIIQELEKKLRNQKHQITIFQKGLELKNRELDALHYVWCDGGCETGAHRYTHNVPLTKELVELAKVNTNRLITHFNNIEFQKLYQPERRKGDEVELIKSNYHDIWFFYAMTTPRKIYHKVLKFFADLVEY